MQRIIQRYQEGGTVQPAIATGLPAGGNAASAIANYMMGPMSANAATLSYTGGGEGVPDYHALAAEQKKLREAAALAEVQSQVTTSNATSSGEDKMEERKAKGGDLYKPKLSQDQINSSYGQMSQPSYTAPILTGGGSDGYGNFGLVGDVLGKAGDALGITDYADLAEKASIERAKNYNGTEYVGTPVVVKEDKMEERNSAGGDLYKGPKTPSYGGVGPRNMGGPIGYNVGGVTQVARTMLPEEQIRQRQMQQAQFSQGQGPLAEIGNALGLKVAGKGVDKALGKMAGSAAMKAAMGSIPVVGPFLAALFG